MPGAMLITEDAQIDHDGSLDEDGRYGLIREALQDLVNKCEQMWKQDRGELECPETLSSEDIAARTGILVELHTELMPALKRKLTSLLAAVFFERPTSVRYPHAEPLLDEILEILTDFGPSLEHIRASIIQLAPWTHTHSRMFSHRDQAYGQLKKFRCDRLLTLFDFSICSFLSQIFSFYITCLDDPDLYHWRGVSDSIWLSRIGAESEACGRKVDLWIQIATGSDFRVLQTDWQDECEALLDSVKIFRSTRELVGLTMHNDRHIPTPMLLALHHLFKDIVNLAALAINFYLPVLCPECLITFPDNLSTNELESVASCTSRLTPIINDMAVSLKDLYKRECPLHINSIRTRRDRVMIWEQTEVLKVAGFKLQKYLDSSLALICFHHLPSPDASQHHPPSENLYRSMFLQNKIQMVPSHDNIPSPSQSHPENNQSMNETTKLAATTIHSILPVLCPLSITPNQLVPRSVT